MATGATKVGKVKFDKRCAFDWFNGEQTHVFAGYRVQGSTSQPDINGFYAPTDQTHNGSPVYLNSESNILLFYDDVRSIWCLGESAVGWLESQGPVETNAFGAGSPAGLRAGEPLVRLETDRQAQTLLQAPGGSTGNPATHRGNSNGS